MLGLDQLNTEQREAVTSTEGPLLILAGAGSGKTKVLTYRIAFLIDSGLARPESILAVTFTNKAAQEMKDRLRGLLTESGLSNLVDEVRWVGTFHAICIKILKQYGELIGTNRNFTIYDSQDQLSAVKDAMERARVSVKEFNPRAILSYISDAKNNLISSAEYSTLAQGYFQQIVSKVYPEYQDILREANAVDFDDIIMNTVALLQSQQKVLENLQNNFKYILVDEYQDTNHAQYILLKLLAKKHKNICCVGDDDQSIYAFRGATIKNILSFEQDYPDTKVVKLEQNYRSTSTILEASYSVISKNLKRKDKKLWTQNEKGQNIVLYKSYDEVSEAEWIIRKIIELKNQNIALSEIVILYRTNAQSRSIEEAFLRSAIPYKIVGGLRFYERKEIKDIVGYLRFVYNPADTTSLSRIINVPRRGIGDKSLEELLEESKKTGLPVGEYLLKHPDNLGPKVKDFARLYSAMNSSLSEMDLDQYINHIITHTGYLKMLDDGTSEGAGRVENLKELVSVASKFNVGNASENLGEFLDEVGLLEKIEEKQRNSEQDSVTLMTIHAAKGLEFEHVFLVGMEENLFPHTNSMVSESEMEEERRLAYVAITRAKSFLYITHATQRQYFGKKQRNSLSRFVKDIDISIIDIESEDYLDDVASEFSPKNSRQFDPVIKLSVGQRVRHPYFGFGVVKRVDFDTVDVDFGSEYGVKELMLEYAKLDLAK